MALKNDLEAEKPLTFSATVPVKRVSPIVPSGARSLVHEEATVVIKIKVEVDSQGNVVNAYSMGADSGSSIAAKVLAPRAVQAARLWHFQPATRDGTPVASETILLFRFGKQSLF